MANKILLLSDGKYTTLTGTSTGQVPTWNSATQTWVLGTGGGGGGTVSIEYELFVSKNGSSGGDGSLSSPYDTVTAALTTAELIAQTSVVRINVAPGVYTEDLSITRSNIIIAGACDSPEERATKIIGTVTVNPTSTTSVFGNNIELSGLYLTRTGATTLLLTGSQACTLNVLNSYVECGNGAYSVVKHENTGSAGGYTSRLVIRNSVVVKASSQSVALMALDRGDTQLDSVRVYGPSASATAGEGILLSNSATLLADRILLDFYAPGAGIRVAGNTAGVSRLTLTNSAVTTRYSAAATAPAISLASSVATLWQTLLTVSNAATKVVTGTGVLAQTFCYYGQLTYGPSATGAVFGSLDAATVTFLAMTEAHGNMNLPALTASLPLKLDASKNVTAAAIALSGSEVTGTLPIAKGGTNGTATPTAGGVPYGTGTAFAFTSAGTSGQPLLSAGAGAPSFGPLDLATAAVTGVLPTANQAAQSMGGDVTGTTAASTVAAIQGRSVSATAPNAGQVLGYTGAAWAPVDATGGGGGGGGGYTYFLNYNVAGEAPRPNTNDKQLSLDYNEGAQVDTGAVSLSTSPTYTTVAEFVTDVGDPGATTIPPGIWEVGLYASASDATGVVIRAILSKWDGTTLTAIATSDVVTVTTTGTPELQTVDFFVPATTLTATERLVVTIEGAKTVALARTITAYFEGTYPSHVHTTFAAPGGTGLIKVFDGVVQDPASLLINADVDANAAIAVSKLDGNSSSGSATKLLHGSDTPGGAPTWAAVSLTADVTGTLPIANGGTNSTATPTAGGAAYGTGSALAYTSAGASGQALISAGAGAPAFGALALDTAGNVSGTLPVGNGGTGSSSAPTAGGVIYGASSSALASTAAGTAGYLLQSNGASPPSWVPAPSGSNAYDVSSQISGKPPASAVVYFKAVRAFTLSTTSADHFFTAFTAASAQTVFTVYRNADVIFTATFAAAGTIATISAVANASISVGDTIKVVAPASQDATLADVYWTMKGSL